MDDPFKSIYNIEMLKGVDSMKLVLTGFGPFGDHKTNASWLGVQTVPQLWRERYL